MARITNKNQLKLDYLKECLLYDPDTGNFTWLYRPRNHFNSDRGWKMINSKYAGTVAECNNNGYVRIRICGYGFLGHQLAYFWMNNGEWPPKYLVIDHINRIRNDNRWTNLRLVDLSENSRNQFLSPRNTSRVTGVSWDKSENKWKASGAYWLNGNKIQENLGRYKDKFEAICVRKSWEIRTGGFTSHHGSEINTDKNS